MFRERIIQFVILIFSAAAFTAAGFLAKPLNSRRPLKYQYEQVITKHPKIVLLQLAPGGLRAPLLTYLWIRSQQLKEDGKFFDAKQQRDLICDLMPHFSGVWAYHAWDMAWNISVATHTPEERWLWVSNGIRLIRDRGLKYNPNDLILYRELAWIFFSKMGQYTDEMHMIYKQRWAAQMHRLLGASPISESTEDVIKAFAPIAEAPDKLEDLLKIPQVNEYVEQLKKFGIKLDETFLEYYNRYSDDPLVAPPTWMRVEPETDKEKQIAELMRSDKYASARKKVLAFVRKKLLTEKYRMDADWMLKLMKRYGPLDWRNVNSHALYWSTLGLHRAMNLDLGEIHALNNDRILLGALKSLTRTGQIYYTPNPNDPDNPFIEWGPDWRFIEPTNREYLRAERILVGPKGKIDDEKNTLRDGHITYLSNVVQMLYLGGREKLARKYYDVIKDVLKAKGKIYQLSLHDFVIEKRREAGVPTVEMTWALFVSALRNAYRALAGGNHIDYTRYRAFAKRIYSTYVKHVGNKPRLKPKPFDELERDFIITLMLRPRAVGLFMPLVIKAKLYNTLSPQMQRAVYPYIAPTIKSQCQQEGLDFNRAFPAPKE